MVVLFCVMEMKNKKTKIVATIGPASESEKILQKMIKEGMDVARLNFSHGDHDWHSRIINKIKKISQETGSNVGILADLQGPRIRVSVAGNLKVRKGETVLISDVAYRKNLADFSAPTFYLDYPEIIKKLKIDQEILVEDGLLKFRITEKRKNFLKAKVLNGGVVRNHKGVNIPGANLDIEVITPKDEKDLQFALDKDVDFVALSFARNGKDIERLRKKIIKILGRETDLPQIVAKIERKEAVDNLCEILKVTDLVMVARGDLGIEMNESQVALLQKEIVAKSLKNSRPVIVATQMLESMIYNPRPTRAEVSDVTNAVIDHADAVMLSGETANGKYPVESVRVMEKIISTTEESPFDDVYKSLRLNINSEYAVIVRSACELAKSFGTKAIVMISMSGFTARLVSHFRPDQFILTATGSEKVWRQLSAVWGVRPYFFAQKNIDTFIDKMLEKAKNEKILKKGDQVVVILGKIPSGEKMRLVGIRKIK